MSSSLTNWSAWPGSIATRGRPPRPLNLLEWAQRDADASGNPLLRARTCQELAKAYSAAGNQAAADEMTRNADECSVPPPRSGNPPWPSCAITRTWERTGATTCSEKSAGRRRPTSSLETSTNPSTCGVSLHRSSRAMASRRIACSSLRSLAAIYEERQAVERMPGGQAGGRENRPQSQ